MSKLVPIRCEGVEFPSVAALCAHYGVERFKTHSRIQRGWSPEEAVGLADREESKFKPKAVTVAGVHYPNLKTAAEALGVNLPTVKARMERGGYSVEEAFLGTLRPRAGTRSKAVTFVGREYPSMVALAAEHGMTSILVSKRVRSGWTLAQALGLEPPPPRFRNFEGHARDQKWKQVRTVDGIVEPVPDVGGYKLYLVTCTASPKVYVGITVGGLDSRLRQHFAAAKSGRKSAFVNAINKYGPQAFRIELLRSDAKTYDELQDQEVQEIVKRDSIRHGYNTAQGGSIGTAKTITVAGRTFPSYLSAAAHYNVDPSVFNLRVARLKWSPEEAAGLVQRDWEGKKVPVAVAGGEFPSLFAAAKHHGVNYKLAHERVNRRGWSIEQALGVEPVPKSSKFGGQSVTLAGVEYPSIAEAARASGVSVEGFARRLRAGMTPEEALVRSRRKSG